MMKYCLKRCFQLSRSTQLVTLPQRCCSTDTGVNTNLGSVLPERIEKSVNQVTLLGRAGADAEMRGTEAHPVVMFSLATHINFQRGEDTIQNTVWHRISVFRPSLRDSVYQNLKKGQRVLVQGRLGYFEKKDPNDDTIINKTASIVAHDVVLFA